MILLSKLDLHYLGGNNLAFNYSFLGCSILSYCATIHKTNVSQVTYKRERGRLISRINYIISSSINWTISRRPL